MQATLFSSTSYGSLITIIFSGYLADLYGPKLVCTSALVLYNVCTMLSPVLAEYNYYVFLAVRAIMGLAEVREFDSLFPRQKNIPTFGS